MRVPARRSGPEKGGVELWKSRRRRFLTVRYAARILSIWTWGKQLYVDLAKKYLTEGMHEVKIKP
jgi:hypothetical protein